MKIFLDPGHGGNDPGAVSYIKEADYTLSYTWELGRVLKNLGFDVNFSRSSDSFVSLEDRCTMANQWQANLFISVHFNAGGGVGIETYALGPGGQGEKLAQVVQDQLIQETGMTNRGVKFANYQVLRGTSMPAILIEGGFVDSSDAEKIKLDSYKQNYIRAVSRALCDFTGVTWSDPYVVQPTPQPQPQADKVSQALSLLQQAIKLLEG